MTSDFMRNPWTRARAAEQRAGELSDALRVTIAEARRIQREADATARLLKQAEGIVRDLRGRVRDQPADVRRLRIELGIRDDIIKALEERLEAARRAEALCERHHSPLVRAKQLAERATGEGAV